MKIATTYENGEIYGHFGHCKEFKIYDIENGEIVSSKVMDAPGNGHSSSVQFLVDNDVYALICGGIGHAAVAGLQEKFIEVYGGCSGNCDERVMEFLGKSLNYSQNPQCAGHDSLEHTCGGECGGSCGGCH